MERKEIREILKNPSLELVKLALSYVNLTDKELKIIELVEMQGKTEERTAEILDISIRNLQQQKSVAFEKLNKVWSNNILIAELLKRGA